MKIASIYQPKPLTILDTATVKEAMAELQKHGFNSLVVVNSENKVVGVLSLQDIAGAVVPQGFEDNVAMAEAMYKPNFFEEQVKEVAKKSVTEVMRKEYICVDLESDIMSITADFLKNDLYIVPVIENEKLIGIITRSEIKHAVAKAMAIHS